MLLSAFVLPAAFAKQVTERIVARSSHRVPTKRARSAPRPVKKRKKKKRFQPVAKPAVAAATPAPVAQTIQPAKKLVIQKEKPRKKRIVIFSSIGGGGHTAVSAGLKSYLKDDYDITVLNVFKDVISSVDTLGTITFGKICAEDFYNFCLRVRWTNVVAGYSRAGNSYLTYRKSTLEKLFLDYFNDEKPDLIISVMPFINAAVLCAAERLDVPFLVLTNDLDTTNYVHNICAPTYKKFKYTLAFDDQSMREKIKHAQFKEDQIAITGFPLRPDFFKKKDKKAIKEAFNVPEDKPVVMVFMGGAGSLASYRYVRTLIKMQLPMHILVCLGRNERLRRNINKILLPEDVSLTIIGFTDRIADLMAISDVLITKPGPGSVCEALESNVPMILDQTGGTIWWEEHNVTFMVDHGFAESLINFTDLADIFPKYIKDPSYNAAIKKKMHDFKRERFNLRIHGLIKDMIDGGDSRPCEVITAAPTQQKKVISSVREPRAYLTAVSEHLGQDKNFSNGRMYR